MHDVARRLWFAPFIVVTLLGLGDVIVATENPSDVTVEIDAIQPAAVPEPLLTPASCKGSLLALTPSTPPPNFGADAVPHERGVFITAMEDFEICNIGYKLDLVVVTNLTVRIYAANGTTRGAQLATGNIAATTNAHVVHFVPINYTLQACQDYEITMSVPASAAWEWWDETLLSEPFDIGGVIRVRDATSDNNPANSALPHFELIGESPSSMVTDLAGPGSPPNTATQANQQRGIYVEMLDTAQMSSFGWEADLDAGGLLTARIYEANGTVRGALIATGTYTVPSAGMQWHDVPINVQLLEGKDYDFTIQYGEVNSWKWWSDLAIPVPFDRDVYRVVDAESAGGTVNTALLHYRVGWDEKTGGIPFDLAKLGEWPAPEDNFLGDLTYGAFVTSVVDQEMYGLGWFADIPAAAAITARVYAADGTVRGSLISEGTLYSSGDRMRWHDIPVAVTLEAGEDYDFEIAFTQVNCWRWWFDTGLPYTSYGVLTVQTGEVEGNPGTSTLIHMRMHACGEGLTPVDDSQPGRAPMFLASPAPNPVTSMSRLDFALEEDGPVSIVVYDVAGRRVTTLFDGQRSKGWHSVDLDSGKLASGVYFIKMQTNMKALSRKFVVAH